MREEKRKNEREKGRGQEMRRESVTKEWEEIKKMRDKKRG